VDTLKVPRSAATELAALLDSPEIASLISELEDTRWTGRPGYPISVMVGLALTKGLYAIPTWTRTVALVREHAALRLACGCGDESEVPSIYACYRFTAKLRRYDDLLAACIERVMTSLHGEMPEMGDDLAVDASDIPAYANGQRFISKGGPERERFSDPDASWGHRSAISTRKGGGFYGYRLHMAVCARTGLPAAWSISTAGSHESNYAAQLLDAARARGFAVQTCAMDKGYDVRSVYDACNSRGCRPVTPLRKTLAVKQGKDKPPSCDHGEWRFAGSDGKRGASKWRCPTGECKPASRWVKADRLHPLIPRETPRWRKLYRGRAAVEREFGRLKNEWALLPLRVRGIERVRLHADLTILAKLSCALARARAAPLAA
jgi:IS5 family transposase